jgi:hypothetical protein
MALKRKVTKAEYTALDPKLQAEYKLVGEEYILEAEGFDDPVELKRAKDHEVEGRKKEKERADKAENDLREEREKAAKATGNVADLERSYKEREAAANKTHKEELAKRDSHLQATLVDSVANQLAAKLGGANALVLLPHIKTRLTSDLTGETPLTRVLGKDGKASAASVEDLEKEIANDPLFKSVIVASKASGGGAAGTGRNANGNGAPAGEKKFKELNDQERADWYKTDPTAFNAASAAARAEALQRPTVQRVL